jgi:hypothetical protein
VGKKKVDENKTWKKLFKKSEKNLKKSEKIGKKTQSAKNGFEGQKLFICGLEKDRLAIKLKDFKSQSCLQSLPIALKTILRPRVTTQVL